MCIPCRRTAFDGLEFRLKMLEGSVKVNRCGFVQLLEYTFNGLGAGLHLA